MSELTMPRLSDSMEEGTIIRWLVEDGARVTRGQELAEIETDKAMVVYESPAEGYLHLESREGETYAVGAVIARVLNTAAEPRDEVLATATAAPVPVPVPVSIGGADTTAPSSPRRRALATPVARRLAAANGIDLAALRGSGPNARIVKDDIAALLASPAPVAEREAAVMGKGESTFSELSRTGQRIARHMAEAKATIPDFSVSTEVAMDACAALRNALRAAEPDARIPSVNDIVVKATALTLREHPKLNSAYTDGRIEFFGRVNVGVAVAAPDTLVVPTIFDADRKSLREIGEASRALAAAVRDGSVTPAQLAGSTFTISNLGMYGVTDFTAIINGRQAAILAVGAVRTEPVVRDGAIVPGQRMRITLVSDHRVVYGADAASFIAALRGRLEQPLLMM
ncbi:MAG TPA: dihydrolipoamide acetyltransferase family protein [Solirubrobacteraceae bacterium]|jgi:pyruvate dehydrogenase E2 component (dihydrolipoamide acetyltransferase)|nr:dihydrolipoamide acetyltransferase family protein [Solirubrobacteraceae bacterium]